MLSSQIDKIFLKNKKALDYIPKEIYEWGKSIIIENYKITKDKSSKEKINGKIIHTQKVLKAGFDILINSPELNLNKYQVATICFLHDIGRFQQTAIYNNFKDFQTMDHGNLSAKLFKNKNFKINKKYHCDESEIFTAIKFHNKKDYKGKNIYPKLARDADKLALLRDRKYIWKNDLEMGYIGKNLNPKILDSFLKNRPINFKIVKTEADIIINRIGWMWNLNLKATKKLFHQNKIPQFFKRKISKMDIDKKNLNLIYQKIDKF